MCDAKEIQFCWEYTNMRLFYFDTEEVDMFIHLALFMYFPTVQYKSLQAATLKTFKSLERNELIFFWHHVQVKYYTVVYVTFCLRL
jgi:hypothetical protein